MKIFHQSSQYSQSNFSDLIKIILFLQSMSQSIIFPGCWEQLDAFFSSGAEVIGLEQ